MTVFRDRRLEQDCPWGGPQPRAARRVFGDLTAYLGRPIEAIAQEYWRRREGEDAIAQRKVGEATDPQTVLAYYAETPHYLYELSYWEASLDKQRWFRVVARACRRYGLRRVLDFGGGIGGLSLYLNARGIRCDHLDVPGKTFDYAAWRFARHRLDVRMLEVGSAERGPAGPYDAVIAWDVLEHLFDLEGAIRQAERLLRPGGWLLSKSTFAVSDGHHEAIHLAQHAKYGDVRVLNDLMARNGLAFRGQLKPSQFSRLLRAAGMRCAVTGVRIVPRLKHGGNFLVHARTGRAETVPASAAAKVGAAA